MFDLTYSILKYSPSMIAGECINVGVLFEYQQNSEFHKIKNLRRLLTFDDELNADYTRQLLKVFQEEFTTSLCNSLEDVKDKTRHLVNEFKFDNPITLNTNNIDKEIENIKKLYLKYDFDKDKRLSSYNQKKLIENILKAKKMEYNCNGKLIGEYNNTVSYDYTFRNIGIKFFDLNNKDINRIMNTAKAWAWNCEKNKSIVTIILYSCNDESNIQMFKDIIGNSTNNFYKFEDGINEINKIS